MPRFSCGCVVCCTAPACCSDWDMCMLHTQAFELRTSLQEAVRIFEESYRSAACSPITGRTLVPSPEEQAWYENARRLLRATRDKRHVMGDPAEPVEPA